MKIMFINNNSSVIHGLSQTALYCGNKSIIYNNFNIPIHEVANKFLPDMIVSNIVNDDILLYLKHNRNIISIFLLSDEQDILKVKENIFMSYITYPKFAANLFDGHYPYTKDKRFIACTNTSKNKNSEKILKNLISIHTKIPIKLFSEDNWPTEYYCGKISESDFSLISNLSWFTIHIGPETQSLYNVALCNSCILSDEELKIPTTIFKNCDELVELINYYNSNPIAYEISVKNSYNATISHATYFNRLEEIFSYFNIDNNIKDRLKELI